MAEKDLKTSLTIKPEMCIRGETVWFEASLENVSKEPARQIADPSADDDAMMLTLEGPKVRMSATSEADRPHRHLPGEDPHLVNLAPGQKLTRRGNLLRWFGELAPGRYTLKAVYTGTLMHYESSPVTLTVQPAAPVFASTPRSGMRGLDTPAAGAWVHRQGNSCLLFYQQQHPGFPRFPRHGIRGVELDTAEPPQVHAAVIPGSAVRMGHLVWRDEKGRLQLAAVDTEQPKPQTGKTLDTPFSAELLASPLALPDGEVLIPVTDAKRQRVAVLEADAAGKVIVRELDLAGSGPLGPYVCYWDCDAALNFGWVTAGGEIFLARLPLTDRSAGFVTRPVPAPQEKILWLDACLDTDASIKAQPYLEEKVKPGDRNQPAPIPPPALTLWCVTAVPGGLRCWRINTSTRQLEPEVIFPAPNMSSPRVLASAVTHTRELAVLLADEQDKLYYASTLRGCVMRIDALLGREITPNQFPGLLAGTARGVYPWVYLRYVKDGSAIDYVRLEPADEPDPFERGQAAVAAGRSGRK